MKVAVEQIYITFYLKEKSALEIDLNKLWLQLVTSVRKKKTEICQINKMLCIQKIMFYFIYLLTLCGKMYHSLCLPCWTGAFGNKQRTVGAS